MGLAGHFSAAGLYMREVPRVGSEVPWEGRDSGLGALERDRTEQKDRGPKN